MSFWTLLGAAALIMGPPIVVILALTYFLRKVFNLSGRGATIVAIVLIFVLALASIMIFSVFADVISEEAFQMDEKVANGELHPAVAFLWTVGSSPCSLVSKLGDGGAAVCAAVDELMGGEGAVVPTSGPSGATAGTVIYVDAEGHEFPVEVLDVNNPPATKTQAIDACLIPTEATRLALRDQWTQKFGANWQDQLLSGQLPAGGNSFSDWFPSSWQLQVDRQGVNSYLLAAPSLWVGWMPVEKAIGRDLEPSRGGQKVGDLETWSIEGTGYSELCSVTETLTLKNPPPAPTTAPAAVEATPDPNTGGGTPEETPAPAAGAGTTCSINLPTGQGWIKAAELAAACGYSGTYQSLQGANPGLNLVPGQNTITLP